MQFCRNTNYNISKCDFVAIDMEHDKLQDHSKTSRQSAKKILNCIHSSQKVQDKDIADSRIDICTVLLLPP